LEKPPVVMPGGEHLLRLAMIPFTFAWADYWKLPYK